MHLSGFCIKGSTRGKSSVFLSLIRFVTWWHNWWLFYFRWGYSTLNNTTSLHFFPIIIIPVRILLCFSIMTILLTLFIISNFGLIIRCIMLSTIVIVWTWFFNIFLIAFWFPFTKALYLWKFYIYDDWWKISTDCRPYTNNFNIFILNRGFLPCWVIFLEEYDALLNLYILLLLFN